VQPLPIDALLPDIVHALRGASRLVLQAEPGAGKTTRVPAALLDAGLAGERDVVVVEPRRIAARAAAAFVARERGGAVGGEVGYRVRFERRGGRGTRLWFVTEGVFGRDLVRDPFLESVGVIVLDEFHERHLEGDLALAVVRELQATVRPDLKLVVMSATLELEALARHLDGAAVLRSAGRAYPVDVSYQGGEARERSADGVVRGVTALLGAGDDGGDVLVFLPGAREIRWAASGLEPLASARGLDVRMLHGSQTLEEQERALSRGPRRRIVLATNVAETSLTVEGVSAVVDTGTARIARFDPRHGMNRLDVVPISKASATQRAGRAGRLAPGRCVRLWSRAEDAARREHETPEVLRLDLTRTVLSLATWGMREPETLGWLDPPPPAQLARARRLLELLGALRDGRVTDLGRRMLAFPVEPRLGRVMVAAEDAGVRADGALVAALAGERDILLARSATAGGGRDFPAAPSDVVLRMDLFEDAARAGFDPQRCRTLGLDVHAVRTVERVRRQLAGDGARRGSAGAETLRRLVLAGFPDRVARRRVAGEPSAVMVGGTGVVVAPESVVREAELFVALDVEAGERGARGEARVRLASAIEPAWLDPQALREERETIYDAARERVVTRTRRLYLDLVLDERIRTDVDRVEAGAVLAEAAVSDPAYASALEERDEALVGRLRFLARAMPELGLPEVTALLRDAVLACAAGRTSLAELRAADVPGAMRGLLTHAQRSALEREAPTQYVLPSGRPARVAYHPDRPPVVAARIQELFGLASTPRLAGGRVPLVLELLAPNQRPVQVTDDLASFWRTTYADVRKELRGRYPRHPWPDDPWTAPPTSRAKRRPR
jgi:ATP-dependent helicase HrpB